MSQTTHQLAGDRRITRSTHRKQNSRNSRSISIWSREPPQRRDDGRDALGRKRAPSRWRHLPLHAHGTYSRRRSTVTQRGQELARMAGGLGVPFVRRRASGGQTRVPEERRKCAADWIGTMEPGIGHNGVGCGGATPAVRPEAGRFTCQALRSRRFGLSWNTGTVCISARKLLSRRHTSITSRPSDIL